MFAFTGVSWYYEKWLRVGDTGVIGGDCRVIANRSERPEGDVIMRIGTGYDVHRLTEGRPLILGGVTVPFDKGLAGHSDADVLLHAIMDALLGAAALGDIGLHFPDTDPEYEGVDSRVLLRKVGALVAEQCYVISNIDATVIAQRPKLRDYINDMRGNIAEDLGLDISQVSVKATTEEGLGFTGAGEGIAAQAVCLLEPMVSYTEIAYGAGCAWCAGCPGCGK